MNDYTGRTIDHDLIDLFDLNVRALSDEAVLAATSHAVPDIREIARAEIARRRACPATMPMNWTTDEVYHCAGIDHHTGYVTERCHVALPGQTAAGVIHMGARWPLDD